MNTILLQALGAAFAVSLISLVGLFLFSQNEAKLRKRMALLVGLAVGALFGNAFIHLIPESLESLSGQSMAFFALLGIVVFFIIDKYLHWSCHDGHCHVGRVGYKVIIADGVHNLVDGIVIGVSFLASPALGLATTLAVALHEIPQEIADFSVLLHSGFSRTKALLLNFLSALVAVAGALIAVSIGDQIESFTPAMLALTAGMFVYLAGSDLIPDLHKGGLTLAQSLGQIVTVIVGIGVMFFV